MPLEYKATLFCGRIFALHLGIHSTLPLSLCPLPDMYWALLPPGHRPLPGQGGLRNPLPINQLKSETRVCRYLPGSYGSGFHSSKYALPLLNSHTTNLILCWVKSPEMICLTTRPGENLPLASNAPISTVCDLHFLDYFFIFLLI